jgi:DNA invertase Pin-like site-specific DNA recombinase
MSVNQTEGKITALYERLSRDDDNAGDSNSIVNQKKYLEGYAAQRGYSNCVHYTDDGWSGGNFERPAWKKLVEDIEAGKVAHVIVKDMSRVGRDYLQTGFYTDVMFRERGVHLLPLQTVWTAMTRPQANLPLPQYHERMVSERPEPQAENGDPGQG